MSMTRYHHYGIMDKGLPVQVLKYLLVRERGMECLGGIKSTFGAV